MSDSEPESPSLPADSKIERTLRRIVDVLYKAEDYDGVTKKRVRDAAADELDLAVGFFKEDSKWSRLSSEIILDEVAQQEQKRANAESSPPPSMNSPAPTKQPLKSGKSAKSTTKRKSPEPLPKPPSKKPKSALSENKATHVALPKSNEDDSKDGGTKSPSKTRPEISIDDMGESDLSDVIDEEPIPKSKAKRKSSSAPKKSKPSAGDVKKPTKPAADQSPQDEEIKKLQSQLIKCGVRKLWGKELKPYETAREKISHLRGMLADVGMTGRFSEDKARQIKESRELAADLEAIQEGDKLWGQDAAEEDDSGGKPRRRTAAANMAALADLMDSDSD